MKRSRLGLFILLAALGVPLLIIIAIASTLVTFTDNWDRPTDFAAQHFELMLPTYGPDEQVPTEPPSFEEQSRIASRVHATYKDFADAPPCQTIEQCLDEIARHTSNAREVSRVAGIGPVSMVLYQWHAQRVASRLALHEPLTPTQWAQVKGLLNAVPEPSFAQLLESERLYALDKVHSTMEASIVKRSDVRSQLARVDDAFDTYLETASRPAPDRFVDLDVTAQWGRLESWTYRRAAYPIPSYFVEVSLVARAQSLKRGVIAGIAVLEYRSRHGRLPQQLDELVPDYLDAVPLDPCTNDQPLRYLLRDEPPGFVIYSVGVDAIDDGGKLGQDVHEAMRKRGTGTDFIIFPLVE